jgi:hypothetical protein
LLLSTFSTRPLSKINLEHQQADGNAQERIGKIKGGPAEIFIDTHIDKIPDQAVIEKAVVKIAANSGSEKSERNDYDFMLRAAEKEYANNPCKGKERNGNEPARVPGEQAERRAVVVNYNKPNNVVDNRNSGVVSEPLKDGPFG